MTTRRSSVLAVHVFVVAALAVTAIAADAKAPPATRTEVGYYSDAGVHVVAQWARPTAATVELPGGPERFVSVEIADDSSPDAYAQISQDVDGDGVDDLFVPICSRSVLPVLVVPHVPVKVIAYQGPCFDGMPARATSGTVTATFSSRP